MRATGDELGLPSPRHSTAGASAENSSHDDFIISTEHDKGGYVRNAGRSWRVGGDGREDWANHSSCRSCSRSVARIAGSGGGVLPFPICLFLRGLTGVKSEYEKDGEAMMTSAGISSRRSKLNQIRTPDNRPRHVTSQQPNQLVPAGSTTVHRRLPSGDERKLLSMFGVQVRPADCLLPRPGIN